MGSFSVMPCGLQSSTKLHLHFGFRVCKIGRPQYVDRTVIDMCFLGVVRSTISCSNNFFQIAMYIHMQQELSAFSYPRKSQFLL